MKSGFVPLAKGVDALGARIELIDAAEHSIDLQVFQIKPDLAARIVSSRLLAAADRGVRVRLLVDDVFTSMRDPQFAILDSHPKVEVRIFNPVVRGVPMPIGWLLGLPRTNRRMHDKALIFDNAIAIVGGRNLADRYYGLDPKAVFEDFGMLVLGPAVYDVSMNFDRYWNTSYATPLDAIDPPETAEEIARDAAAFFAPVSRFFSRGTSKAEPSIGLIERLETGSISAISAAATVASDPPAKLNSPRGRGERVVAAALISELANAQREVVFVSPYFVPRADGSAYLIALAERGVDVSIVTNSLASTNQPLVHGGYARWRRDLLAAGIKFYEIRVDGGRNLSMPPRHTLHAKLVLIDRQTVMFGSLNLDPRSFELNSEIGIFVRSSALANWLFNGLRESLTERAYAVSLDDTGNVTWRSSSRRGTEVRYSDPSASTWRKLVAALVTVFPSLQNQL